MYCERCIKHEKCIFKYEMNSVFEKFGCAGFRPVLNPDISEFVSKLNEQEKR